MIKLESCRKEAERLLRSGALPSAYAGLAKELCEGAVRGLDLESFSGGGGSAEWERWAEWLSWSTVALSENDYLVAAMHGLALAPKLAKTDYGTARQRDLGQLWTDAIRGLLGEVAFAKWLRERFGAEAELDYRRGRLQEFLPSDIKSLNGRPPRLGISIKTTKLQGIWLDVPYSQLRHSEIFVLVRIGLPREHLLAFLKSISAVRDKILRRAQDLRVVTPEEAEEVWSSVPEFASVPAYVAGFFDRRAFSGLQEGAVLEADGEVKRTRVVINRFAGFWDSREEESYRAKVLELLRRRGRQVPQGARVEFEGIGGFSKALHFVVSSGLLERAEEKWRSLLSEL